MRQSLKSRLQDGPTIKRELTTSLRNHHRIEKPLPREIKCPLFVFSPPPSWPSPPPLSHLQPTERWPRGPPNAPRPFASGSRKITVNYGDALERRFYNCTGARFGSTFALMTFHSWAGASWLTLCRVGAGRGAAQGAQRPLRRERRPRRRGKEGNAAVSRSIVVKAKKALHASVIFLFL